jgi:DNA-binding transcriptional LysR family regulator
MMDNTQCDHLSYLLGMALMNLRQLHYFVTVAEESGVCRAAVRLHIAQPALTRQIRALERDLGTRLFVREKKGMRLTEAGRFLLKEARQMLSMSRHAFQMTQSVGRGEAGRLEIAFVSPVFQGVLSKTISRFRKLFPLVELHIQEMDPYRQIQELLDQKIDLACPGVMFPGFEDQLLFERVCEAPLLVALPPDHRLRRRREVPLALLSRETFICPAPGVRRLLLKTCRSAGFEPLIVEEGNNLGCSLELVAAGMGVTLVTGLLPRQSSTGVHFRALSPDVPRQALYTSSHKENQPPKLRAFLEIFTAIARASISSP